jgi:hypothetical protein
MCPECLEAYTSQNPKSSCDAFEQCRDCHAASDCCPTEPTFEPCDVIADLDAVFGPIVPQLDLVDRVIAIMDGAL